MSTEQKFIFTEKGREFISLSEAPWVDLPEETLFEEISLLFLLWVGHNETDIATEGEMVDATKDIMLRYLDYILDQKFED